MERSGVARALGTSEGTARRYLDILTGAFMVRALPPWFENLRKRQVKAPKVYVRDTGLLHELLGLSRENELAGHHKVGASFEGFAVEQLLAGLDTRDAYFWATHGGAELDLLVFRGGKRYGFECRFADAPGTTRSMRVALEDLGLTHLWIVYPERRRTRSTTGSRRFRSRTRAIWRPRWRRLAGDGKGGARLSH